MHLLWRVSALTINRATHGRVHASVCVVEEYDAQRRSRIYCFCLGKKKYAVSTETHRLRPLGKSCLPLKVSLLTPGRISSQVVVASKQQLFRGAPPCGWKPLVPRTIFVLYLKSQKTEQVPFGQKKQKRHIRRWDVLDRGRMEWASLRAWRASLWEHLLEGAKKPFTKVNAIRK